MGAVKNIENKNVLSLLAGNDLLISTDYEESIKEIRNATEDDTLGTVKTKYEPVLLNKSDIDNILNGKVGYTNIKDLRNNYFGNCNIVLNKDLDYIRISYFADVIHSYILKKKYGEWKIFVE